MVNQIKNNSNDNKERRGIKDLDIWEAFWIIK